MSARGHERYEDDLGAFLLGALPDEESAEFERHLATCAACRQEADRLRPAADALPRSVEPYAAPASLKRSLMRTVLDEAGERPRERTPLAERLGLGRLRPQLVGLAVGLLVLGGLVGFGIDRLGSSGERTIAAQVDHLRVGNATASLTVQGDPSRGGQLRVSGLRSPGPGHVYEVWLQRGSQVEHSSLFSVTADGAGAAGIPQSLEGVDRVLVTREQAPSGAMAPTSTPIISVKT